MERFVDMFPPQKNALEGTREKRGSEVRRMHGVLEVNGLTLIDDWLFKRANHTVLTERHNSVTLKTRFSLTLL
jgi:hypothetical protein